MEFVDALTPVNVLVASAALGATTLLRVGKREKHLPPGPPTTPFFGNALGDPLFDHGHFQYTEWARQYGGIFSLKKFHNTTVVISDVTILKEFMDRRGESAGRPENYLVQLITGGNVVIDMDPTTELWKNNRKAFRLLFSPKATKDYNQVIMAENTQLAYDLLRSPEKFELHIARYNYSTSLSVSFGQRCPTFDKDKDPIFRSMKMFVEVLRDAPPLDDLPFLKYVPKRWAPWKERYKDVKDLQGAAGQSNGSFMDELIPNQKDLDMTREEIAYMAGTAVEAGTMPTNVSLRTLFLCLGAFPEAVKEMQKQIDTVLSDGRPPTMDDLDSIPYIGAFVRESMRYRPPFPLGVPHAMVETHTYRGYVVPKGAIVLMNVWAIMHDPDYFDEPDEFRPERFLASEHGTKPGVSDQDWRYSIAFGSGKRLCPGTNFSIYSLNFAVAMLAWAFDFGPGIDPVTKKPIPLDVNAFEPGFPNPGGPLPFSLSITPRSEAKAAMIKQIYGDAASVFSKFELFLSPEEKSRLAKERASL